MEKLHRLCEYTLITFKCQSIRSEVHSTNKTLHNESQKNVTVHLGPRVTCAKNMTDALEAKGHWAALEELLEVVGRYFPCYESVLKSCKEKPGAVLPIDLSFATKFLAVYLFIKVKGSVLNSGNGEQSQD